MRDRLSRRWVGCVSIWFTKQLNPKLTNTFIASTMFTILYTTTENISKTISYFADLLNYCEISRMPGTHKVSNTVNPMYFNRIHNGEIQTRQQHVKNPSFLIWNTREGVITGKYAAQNTSNNACWKFLLDHYVNSYIGTYQHTSSSPRILFTSDATEVQDVYHKSLV